jgi:hypothetical protein
MKTLAVILFAFGTILATATSLAPEESLEKRVQSAEKIFVGTLINRKVLEDDWCHADLKVTRVIAGVTVDELIPVQWRPEAATYNAKENQVGLAILRYKDGKRYWLRPDTFVDPKFADEAIKFLENKDQ